MSLEQNIEQKTEKKIEQKLNDINDKLTKSLKKLSTYWRIWFKVVGNDEIVTVNIPSINSNKIEYDKRYPIEYNQALTNTIIDPSNVVKLCNSLDNENLLEGLNNYDTLYMFFYNLITMNIRPSSPLSNIIKVYEKELQYSDKEITSQNIDNYINNFNNTQFFDTNNNLDNEDKNEITDNLKIINERYFNIEKKERQKYRELKKKDQDYRYGLQHVKIINKKDIKICGKGYLDGDINNKSHPIIPLIVFIERFKGLYDTYHLGLRKDDKDSWFYNYAYKEEEKHYWGLLKEYIGWDSGVLNKTFGINNNSIKIKIIKTNQDDVDLSVNYVPFEILEVEIIEDISQEDVIELVKKCVPGFIFGRNHIDWNLAKIVYNCPPETFEQFNKEICESKHNIQLSEMTNIITTDEKSKIKQYVYGAETYLKYYMDCPSSFNCLGYKTCVKDRYYNYNQKKNELYNNICHPLVEWSPYANILMTYVAIMQDMDFPIRFVNEGIGFGKGNIKPREQHKLNYSFHKYKSSRGPHNILKYKLLGVYVYVIKDDRDSRLVYNSKKDIIKLKNEYRKSISQYTGHLKDGENVNRILIYPLFKIPINDRTVNEHFTSLYKSNKLSQYAMYHMFMYDIPKGLLFQNNRTTYDEFNFLVNYMKTDIYCYKEEEANLLFLTLKKSFKEDEIEKLRTSKLIKNNYIKYTNMFEKANTEMHGGSKDYPIKIRTTKKIDIINPNIASYLTNDFYNTYLTIIKATKNEINSTFKLINKYHPYKHICFFTPFISKINYLKNGTTVKQILNKDESNTILKYQPKSRNGFLIGNEILARFNLISNLSKSKKHNFLVVSNGTEGIEAINYQCMYHNVKANIDIDVVLNHLFNEKLTLKESEAIILNKINKLREHIMFQDRYISNLTPVSIETKYNTVYLSVKVSDPRTGDITVEVNSYVTKLEQLLYGLKKLEDGGNMIINISSMLTKVNADIFLLMKQYFDNIELYCPEIIPKSYITRLYMVMTQYNNNNNFDKLEELIDNIKKQNLTNVYDLELYSNELLVNYYSKSTLDYMSKQIESRTPKILSSIIDIADKDSEYDYIRIFNQYYYYQKLQYLNNIINDSDTDNSARYLIESINYAKKYDLDIITIGSNEEIANNKYGKIILEDLYSVNKSLNFDIRPPTKDIKEVTNMNNQDTMDNTISAINYDLSLNNLIFNITNEEYNDQTDVAKELTKYYQNNLDLYLNSKFTRVVTDEYPRIDYIERKQLPRTTVHLGQLKLLFTEIEFFTLFTEPKKKCIAIYAGAAPGSHIPYLKKLFPHISYILYDPRDFSKKLDNVADTYVYQEYFTDEVATKLKETFKDEDIYFISDIRTVVTEDDITSDLDMQKKWVEILKPKYSMLKFRLPRTNPTYKYLSGDVYLQIWSPISSTETRLMVPENHKTVTYDVDQYEGQLQYFNRIARVQYYQHSYNIPGFDHCYDCYSELNLLENYFKKYKFLHSGSIKDNVEMMVYKISKLLGYNHPNTFQTYDKFIVNRPHNTTHKKSIKKTSGKQKTENKKIKSNLNKKQSK